MYVYFWSLLYTMAVTWTKQLWNTEAAVAECFVWVFNLNDGCFQLTGFWRMENNTDKNEKNIMVMCHLVYYRLLGLHLSHLELKVPDFA